jgi:hypothetical protein
VALLADYLEHRLSSDVQTRLERHLAKCDLCLRQLRTYESTVSMLRSITEEELPPELRLSLKAFLGETYRCKN